MEKLEARIETIQQKIKYSNKFIEMQRRLMMLGMMLGLIIGMALSLTAQQLKSTNYYGKINNHDLSKLWKTDPDKKELDVLAITVPEPLGFIGENCQRFYIHYTAITKCKTNPCQYNVTGKTKVKDNVCSFSGSITIIKVGIFTTQFDYRYKQGFVECEINFKEDSTLTATGFIKGKLTTKFYLDDKRIIQYDDLLFGADLYFNN